MSLAASPSWYIIPVSHTHTHTYTLHTHRRMHVHPTASVFSGDLLQYILYVSTYTATGMPMSSWHTFDNCSICILTLAHIHFRLTMCMHRGLLSYGPPQMKHDCLWHVWCNSACINHRALPGSVAYVKRRGGERRARLLLFYPLLSPPHLFIALLSRWSTASYSENFPNRWNGNSGVIQNELWNCLIYFSSNFPTEVAQQDHNGH